MTVKNEIRIEFEQENIVILTREEAEELIKELEKALGKTKPPVYRDINPPSRPNWPYDKGGSFFKVTDISPTIKTDDPTPTVTC